MVRSRRNRGRGRSNSGRSRRPLVTHQFYFAENLASGVGTINVIAKNFNLPIDRPVTIAFINLEIAATYDVINSNTQPVIVQIECRAPDGTPDGRVLYRSMPRLITPGVVRRQHINIPYAGMFQYGSNSILCRGVFTSSLSVTVGINVLIGVRYGPPEIHP